MPPLEEGNRFSKLECSQVPDKYIISIDTVEKQLAKLKTKKAAGPDRIPSWILRDFSHILAGSTLEFRKVWSITFGSLLMLLSSQNPPQLLKSENTIDQLASPHSSAKV